MNTKTEKLLAGIIASRLDLAYEKFMSSPDSLFAEAVRQVDTFNQSRAAKAQDVTVGDVLDSECYFLPAGESSRLLIPPEFLKPIDIHRLPDLGGFVQAVMGAVQEDRGEQCYQKPITIFCGDTGTGKTRAAYFNLAGYSDEAYCLSACHLKRCVNSVGRSPSESGDYFQTLCNVENLFLDDLSMCSFSQSFFEYFMEVLNHRTCNELNTVFTLQAHPNEWGNMLEGQGITPLAVDALLRRLAEFSYFVQFKKMES